MFQVASDMAEKQKEYLESGMDNQNTVFFDEFIKSLAATYKDKELPEEIRIAKDEDALLDGDYEPALVIRPRDFDDVLQYKGMPMWRNDSNDQLYLHGLGLIEGSKTDVSQFSLYDTNPHINIGGATGHGKSVLANSILVAASLVHPPWLMQFYLSDPKITEMKPYATSEYKLPHVDAVAATEDPEYAISVIEFLLAKMDKRASIFDKFKVKNIDSFNKESGLVMPMMILVLDELKAMLGTAGRRAGHVDKLIQAFVAKARFAGGRCIMLSQGVVTELDPATMKNINIRVALGCTPEESTKLVGNAGASVNLGSRGKITYNDTPSKSLSENVYITTPFLPDKSMEQSNNIYEIFEHQQKVWEKITHTGARITPLSFFDQTSKLTRQVFDQQSEGLVDKEHIFLGEPVYINKSPYPLASISLDPPDEYSDNIGNNIMFQSGIAKERLNFTATLLNGFDKLREGMEVHLKVFSPLSQTNERIESLGYKVDGYSDSGDISLDFNNAVQSAALRILLMKADEIAFSSNPDVEETVLQKRLLDEVSKITPLTELMRLRAVAFMNGLDEQTNQLVFGFDSPLVDKPKVVGTYKQYVDGMVWMYQDFGCESTQMNINNIPMDIRLFYDYHMLNGVEVKTNRSLDMWMSIVKLAPVYGIHFIFITDMLPNSGSSLNGIVNKIIYYQPTTNAIGQQKLSDDYPQSTLDMMYIFANKTLPKDKCVKIKKVDMLGG